MADPVFLGRVATGCEGISYDSVQELINQKKHLQSIGVGQPVEVIIRKPRKDKTHPQLAYYRGVILKNLHEWSGEETNRLHEQLLEKFAPRSEITTKMGTSTVIVRSSKMSTIQMNDYCQDIRVFFLSEFNFRIPEPNEVEI